VRLASAVTEDLLLSLYGERVEVREDLSWSNERERVEGVESMRFGAVVLDETRGAASASPRAAEGLVAPAREQPTRCLMSEPALRLGARLALCAEYFPKAGLPADPALVLEDALLRAAAGATSFADLTALDWLSFLSSGLTNEQRRLLDAETPER